MSDTSQSEPTGEEAPDPGALRERGDKAEAKVKELEAQLAAQARELAFTNAGVPNEGVGSLFRKAYDGELTTEAIAEAMASYGLTNPEPEPEAAPAPEGAGVVNTIAAGMANDQPVEQPGAVNETIQEMLRQESQSALEMLLRDKGLLMDSAGPPPQLMGEVPEV